jgi:glutamyl-tRNA synthetase
MSLAFTDCKTLEDFEHLFPERSLPPGTEVTRIAPSPTGMPHIGTAMQSVLHRAIALKSHGIYILRVEDTDVARTIDGAVEAIIEGLKWLGTTPDEGMNFGGDYGPYLQTKRLPLYKLASEKLVNDGHAYHCFCTEERLNLVRKTQTAQGQSPGYDGHCRDLDKAEVAKRVAAGEKNVVRLKVPKNETITFHDEVRGNISFETSVVDDSVLLKSDGIPTYHLASVVDDHFMRITIVVRGEEWISSAPKHGLVYRYLGYKMPRFLHTVLLRDKQKRKLSKRSGDTALTWFRRQGILPEAFCNFLYRIMWAHPEGKDIYPLSEFAERLTFTALPSTGPVVDMDLLLFINGKYMSALTKDQLRDGFGKYLDYLIDNNLTATNTLHQDMPSKETAPEDLIKLRQAMKADPAYALDVLSMVAQRCGRFGEILFGCNSYYDFGYVAPTRERLTKECPDVAKQNEILKRFLDAFSAGAQTTEVEGIMKGIARDLGLKDRAVFMTIRLAMTGEEKTPPHGEVAALLGKDRVVRRLTAVLNSAPSAQAAHG